ncbi:MAG TPA: triose-phosphate isomerase [Bacteroidales bacterium]|nr:triose-phosphate isomerase [Bacteroidales bacterium]
MRKKIVAGNWKMNLNLESGRKLVAEVCNLLKQTNPDKISEKPEVVFFPPFVFITEVAKIAENIPGVGVGVQNISHEEKGAYTGEVSASMVRSCGATYTLIGHSERRTYFKEDDNLLARKLEVAIRNGLTPVYCCGEIISERKAGKHFEVVGEQMTTALFWMNKAEFEKIVIAYEPVWAIGTGVTATPLQAQEMHAFIRTLISEKFGNETGQKTTILYGGSCNAQNAAELFSQPDVDGGLIGGASLNASEFFAIVNSF